MKTEQWALVRALRTYGAYSVAKKHEGGDKVYSSDVSVFLKDAGSYAGSEAEEWVTIPADVFRTLLAIAADELKVATGRPPDSPAQKLRKWAQDPNFRAARYAERLKRVWWRRYKHRDSEAAIRHAVWKIGDRATEDKVRKAIHSGRHKNIPT